MLSGRSWLFILPPTPLPQDPNFCSLLALKTNSNVNAPPWKVLCWNINLMPSFAFSVCCPTLAQCPLSLQGLVTLGCQEDPFLPGFCVQVCKPEKEKKASSPSQRTTERVRRFLVRTFLKSVRDWAAILRQAGSKLTGLLCQQGPGMKITATASPRL